MATFSYIGIAEQESFRENVRPSVCLSVCPLKSDSRDIQASLMEFCMRTGGDVLIIYVILRSREHFGCYGNELVNLMGPEITQNRSSYIDKNLIEE